MKNYPESFKHVEDGMHLKPGRDVLGLNEYRDRTAFHRGESFDCDEFVRNKNGFHVIISA